MNLNLRLQQVAMLIDAAFVCAGVRCHGHRTPPCHRTGRYCDHRESALRHTQSKSGNTGGSAVASIVRVAEIKKAQASDETLMMADMAAKARVQVASFVFDLLSKRLPRKKAEELAIIMSEGRWTHDFPISVQAAQELGFPVNTNMPRIVYELMDLYPQASARRPSVIYVPTRSAGPSKGDIAAPKAVPADSSK